MDGDKTINFCGKTINLTEIYNSRLTRIIVIIIGLLLISIILMFLSAIATQIIPQFTVQDAMSRYSNNSTMAAMHLDVANNLLMFLTTFAYVILTLFLVYETTNTVKESRNAIDQSKKEQKIRDIENKLEKFYIPTYNILTSPSKYSHYYTIEGDPEKPYIGLREIRKYNYLADEKTYNLFETYVQSIC